MKRLFLLISLVLAIAPISANELPLEFALKDVQNVLAMIDVLYEHMGYSVKDLVYNDIAGELTEIAIKKGQERGGNYTDDLSVSYTTLVEVVNTFLAKQNLDSQEARSIVDTLAPHDMLNTRFNTLSVSPVRSNGNQEVKHEPKKEPVSQIKKDSVREQEELLKKYKVDKNKYPIHAAALVGDILILKTELAGKTDSKFRAKDANGHSPLYYAQKNNQKDAEVLLRQHIKFVDKSCCVCLEEDCGDYTVGHVDCMHLICTECKKQSSSMLLGVHGRIDAGCPVCKEGRSN